MTPTYVYRHFGPDDELLYVGVSKDHVQRLSQHCAEWKSLVCRSEVITYPTREGALAAEAEAIRTERPKFNRTYLPRNQRQKQQSMTPKQYREAISKLGMSQGEAAEFLGISIRTSNGYANDRIVPEHVAKLLRLMIRLKLKPEDI